MKPQLLPVGDTLVNMTATARRLLGQVKAGQTTMSRADEGHLFDLRETLQQLAERGAVRSIAGLPERVG